MSVTNLPRSLRIGVLRGGPSTGYDDSLQTGNFIIQNLVDTHKPIDIFISNDGTWHMQGVPKSPENIFKHLDVVFNGLHGTFGEDGHVQEILNHHGVKYTGSDRYPSGLTMNRWLVKEHLKPFGIKTPVAVLVRRTDSLNKKAKEIWNSIPTPLVIKPARGGYSSAYYKADFYQELITALSKILSENDSALVEEYINGTRASSGVIEGFRDKNLYTLAPVELDSSDNPFYPTRFTDDEKNEMEHLAKIIHKGLRLRHYSTTDFIVTPRRGIYVLEVNTQPKLGEKSVIRRSLEAVGVSIRDFIHHTINLALNKN
ncbi:MAG: D-alanine-D-alanine ligase [Parcubacteria bacterium C7867-006]|nr:MAG: D-alanine-D-alanine ligase [Parcubacteria bacterium C7867-006]